MDAKQMITINVALYISTPYIWCERDKVFRPPFASNQQSAHCINSVRVGKTVKLFYERRGLRHKNTPPRKCEKRSQWNHVVVLSTTSSPNGHERINPGLCL
jgi:hypothetical protein